MARVRKVEGTSGIRGTWPEALDEFLEYRKAGGLSPQTLSDYNRTVHLFFKRFPHAWDTETQLKESAYSHLSDDVMPATFNNRLIYLRTFLNYCVEQDRLVTNPIANIKSKKTESRIVAIEMDILRALLSAPDQSTFVGIRDYTLILLTIDTGIRPKEAHSLQKQDFNFASREIFIPAKIAKTRVSRTLPISEITARSIRKLISVRSDDWDDNIPIFCSYEGTRLNRHTWGDRLELYGEKIGRHIRPYDLRHVFALEFIRNGANAFSVMKILGHSNMETTRRYVALVKDDVKAAHDKSSPLNTVIVVPTKRNTKI